MYDLPIQVSPAQTEAKEILAHLLEELKDPGNLYYDRYGPWVERHPTLHDYITRCVRPSVWTFLRGRWSLDNLKAVGGDLRFEGRAIYFDGILGVDKRVRIYIGQTTFLRQRVAQHLNFRYRRDNPSLHYYAMERSVYNTIGAVASIPSPHTGNQNLPGMDAPDLLLNVLEMWIALVFRTLPDEMLDAWIPDHESVTKGRKAGKEGIFGGLNVACPLDQGGERHWSDLSESQDPLVKEYIAHLKPTPPPTTPTNKYSHNSQDDHESHSNQTKPHNQDLSLSSSPPPPSPQEAPHHHHHQQQQHRPPTPEKKKEILHLRKISEEPILDTPEDRKIAYAEKARRFNEQQSQQQVTQQGGMLVPQWMVYGTAAVVVGLVVLNIRTAAVVRR